MAGCGGAPRRRRARHREHGQALARGDGQLAAQFLARRQFGPRPFRQPQDFLGAGTEDAPLLGERHGARAAHEQVAPQFLLQLPQLLGERGLRDEEQPLGRAGDVPLAGHGQKVAKHAQFHGKPFLSSMAGILSKYWRRRPRPRYTWGHENRQ